MSANKNPHRRRQSRLRHEHAEMLAVLHEFEAAMTGCPNTGNAHKDMEIRLNWLDHILIEARAALLCARGVVRSGVNAELLAACEAALALVEELEPEVLDGRDDVPALLRTAIAIARAETPPA